MGLYKCIRYFDKDFTVGKVYESFGGPKPHLIDDEGDKRFIVNAIDQDNLFYKKQFIKLTFKRYYNEINTINSKTN